MPKVPTIQPGQVQTRSLPGVRDRSRAPTSLFARDLEVRGAKVLAGAVGAIADAKSKESDKADKSKVRIDSSDARKDANNLLKGEGGYLSQLGKNADETKEDYQKKFKLKLDEYDKRFTNDKQRELWQVEKSRIELDFNNSLESHAFRERQSYIDSKMKDSMSNIKEDIASNYAIPNKTEEGLNRLKEVSEDYADMKGYSAESKAKLLKDNESSVHSVTIAKMVEDNNDQMAKQYFSKYKDKMNTDDKMRAQSIIEEGSVRGESQRQTDKIMSKDVDQAAALEEARAIKDPEVRDETVRRINHRYSEKKQIEEGVSRQIYEKSFAAVDANPSRDSIPADDWNKLKPSQKKNIQSYIDYKRKGKEILTKWDKYYDLKTMASSPTERSKFLKMDLLDHRMNLGDAEFKEMVKLQTDLRAGKGEAQTAMDGYRSDKQVVDDAMQSAGFDLRDKSQENMTEINNIRSEIDRRVQAHKQKTGKKYIENKDLQYIVDSFFIEGTDPDSGFFGFFKTTKRAYEIEPGEQFEINVDSIPKYARQRIEQALKIEGKPITDENIANKYLMRMKQIERGR